MKPEREQRKGWSLKMSVLNEIWKACLVKRWHTNADLSWTVDYIGCHSARMALLAYKVKPSLRKELILAILSHDLGEYKAGDAPYPLKVNRPDVWEGVEEFENDYKTSLGFCFPLSSEEKELLSLFDRLDAYLWVKLHKPDILEREDWLMQLSLIYDLAVKTGVEEEVKELLNV
jgi:hypothetical protein